MFAATGNHVEGLHRKRLVGLWLPEVWLPVNGSGLVVLGLLARPLGMVPALSLFVLVQLLLVLRAPFWPSVVTILVIAVLIEGIFVRWLSVPVPPPFFV